MNHTYIWPEGATATLCRQSTLGHQPYEALRLNSQLIIERTWGTSAHWPYAVYPGSVYSGFGARGLGLQKTGYMLIARLHLLVMQW